MGKSRIATLYDCDDMFAATLLPIIINDGRGVNSLGRTFAFDFWTSQRRVILSYLYSSYLFRSVVQTYPPGHITPRHEHDWAQLLYASSGVMAIESGEGSWIVPPQLAIWLPARTWHVTRTLTRVNLASLYLRQTRGGPTSCEVLQIDPLMRELLVAAMKVDFSQKLSRREKFLARLIGEELSVAPRGGSPIPMPEDHRLLAFCRRVIENPSLRMN